MPPGAGNRRRGAAGRLGGSRLPAGSFACAVSLALATPVLAGVSGTGGAPAAPDRPQSLPEAAARCEAATREAAWDEAARECAAAIEESPEMFGIHYFLGFAHQARGSWGQAAAAFEAFLAGAGAADAGDGRFDEQLALATRSAGLAHLRAGAPEAALPLLQQAAENAPEDAEVAFGLGTALLDAHEPEAAEASFLVVVANAPEISPALYFLGRIRYDAGDYIAAEERFGAFLDTAPTGALAAEARWLSGSMALRRSAEAAAAGTADAAPAAQAAGAHFRGFLEIETEGDRAAAAHYFLGTIALDADDCAAAVGHYRRFLDLAPDHERAAEVTGYLTGAGEDCRPDPVSRASFGPWRRCAAPGNSACPAPAARVAGGNPGRPGEHGGGPC